MSKYMQLTTKIRPYYKKDLKKAYPRIARQLSFVDGGWVEEGPSLFEIVGSLDRLVYQLGGDAPFREILLRHRGTLHKLYEDTQEEIADWHLARADQLLYEMEDIFDEIERELGEI